MLTIDWRSTKHRYKDELIEALVIDGKVYEQSQKSEDDEYGLGCFVRERVAVDTLLNQNISTLTESFDYVALEVLGSAAYEGQELLDHALPLDRFHFNLSAGILYLVYQVYFGPGERAQRNLANFKAQVEDVLNKEAYEGQLFLEAEVDPSEVSLGIDLPDADIVAREFAESSYQLARAALSEAWDRIWEDRPLVEGLTRHFEFPPEVRSACEKYLIYFSQFLADLGVEADTALQTEPSGVLFTVCPRDRGTALENIREALDLYLSLPWDGTLEKRAVGLKDLAVQELLFEVHTLRGRVTLAGLQAEAQRATIEQLRLSNAVLQGAFASPRQSAAADDRVDLWGGLVTLKPVEFPGLTANLPELWRRIPEMLKLLKRRLPD